MSAMPKGEGWEMNNGEAMLNPKYYFITWYLGGGRYREKRVSAIRFYLTYIGWTLFKPETFKKWKRQLKQIDERWD